MLLGLVLHSTEVYLVSDNHPWPKDPLATSIYLDYLEYLIHIFRMPIFFIMAGFFGAMLFYKRGRDRMIRNRVKRIFLPFVVFLVLLYPITVFALDYVKSIFSGSPNPFQESMGLDLLIPTFTIHLWFLYYLFLITIFAVLLASLIGRDTKFGHALNRVSQFVFTNRIFRIPILGSIIFVLLVIVWNLAPPTPLSWIPDMGSFLFYFFFYAFGWFLFKSRKTIPYFEHRAVINCILGTVFFTIGFIFKNELGDIRRGVFHAFSMAFFVYGLIGVFSRYYDYDSGIIRYLSASSYWAYLIHLPFTILIPGALFAFEVPAVVKFLITLSITSIICLISYQFMVRSTFIGVFLNGRKYGSK